MAKKRFTWLDGVLIGVVLLVIVGAAVWYFSKGDTDAGNTAVYEVTLRFNRATADEYDYYKVGDTMYFQDRTAVLGTITKLTPIDKVCEDYDAVNGRYVKVVDPERSAVEMTLEVRGGIADGAFTVNGEPVQIGQVFYPQSDTTRSIMTVWDIEEVAA